MFDAVKRMYYKVRTPRSIQDALSRVASPTLVSRLAKSNDDSDLIAEVAKEVTLSDRELLERVARELKLESMWDIPIPSKLLIDKTGHKASTLRKRLAVPVVDTSAPAGYCFVIADPLAVNIEEFRKYGIPIKLSLPSEIGACWKKQEGLKEISEQQLFSILKRLAFDAYKYGAEHVTIGWPTKNEYEFRAKGDLYRGRLHPAIFTTLMRFLAISNKVKKHVDYEHIAALAVTLDERNGQHTVKLSWEKKSIMEEFVSSLGRREKPQNSNVIEISDKIRRERQEREQQQEARSEVRAKASPNVLGLEDKPFVVLVDDDERFLFILSRIMEGRGWTVKQSSNAEHVLDSLITGKLNPDLIISDVHMPGMDGPTFVTRMRQAKIGVPVLMLTSDQDQFLEAELAMKGIDAFVNKQQDPKILLAWAMNLIKKDTQESQKTARAANESTSSLP